MNQSEIILNMPAKEYREAPGVNISALKRMRLSPAHYKFNLEQDQDDKHSVPLIVGTLVHQARLEPEKLCYVVRPDKWDSWRTNDAKAWRDAQTLPVVTPDEEKQVKACADALGGIELLNELAARGNTEVTAFKRDERTGLMKKGRADLVAVDDAGITWIVDIKTVPDGGASLDAFSRKVADLDYHLQAAWYCDLFDTDNFRFVAVEKTGYNGVGIFHVTPEDLQIARRVNAMLLQQLAGCIEKQSWPGYPSDSRAIQMPRWKMKQDGADL